MQTIIHDWTYDDVRAFFRKRFSRIIRCYPLSADDLFHDFLERLIKYQPKNPYNPDKGPVEAYLHWIAKCSITDNIRKHLREKDNVQTYLAYSRAQPKDQKPIEALPSLEDVYSRHETLHNTTLTPTQKELIRLYLEGYTRIQATKHLRISLHSLHARGLHTALQKTLLDILLD